MAELSKALPLTARYLSLLTRFKSVFGCFCLDDEFHQNMVASNMHHFVLQIFQCYTV